MPDYRAMVIEECARELETIAVEYLDMASRLDPEDRDQCFELAHSYELAAEDLRRLIPENREKEERFRGKVREWLARLLRGEKVDLPHPDRRRNDD